MGQAIFVTGTDTGVGKTFFTCGLARWLKSYGYNVGAMKPAETGCELRDGLLYPEDAWRLKEATGCAEPIERVCPYRLAEPLAPSIAAERAGVKIDIDHMLAVFAEIKRSHDITLVEGAGGLMVPLVPSYTFADLARVAKLPMIVVAANKLGVINHLLLSLEHASCMGLTVLGYVLNRSLNEQSVAAETNREVLLGLTGVPCLGELPFHQPGSDPADLFETELDLTTIHLLLEKL
jgi:dethiobiotin synthetase